MRAVGIDATLTSRGWVSVALDDGNLHTIRLARSLAEILEAQRDADVIAVNLPVGHDDPDGSRNAGVRACDAAARAYLGANAEQVAPVPPLAVFTEHDLDAAHQAASRKGWPSPDEVLWRHRGRIGEVNAAAERDPRLREAHPEVSYTVLLRLVKGGEADLEHTRTTSLAAQHERLSLLHEAGLRPARSLGGIGRLSPEDVLTASVLAWSAQRAITGDAISFPAQAPEGTPRIWA